MTSKLSTDVFLSSEEGLSSTCTLIKGEREAVLVDVPFLLSDGQRLVADVLDTGRQLTTIFVTHAHPDHWFSLPIFAAQFPEARIVANEEVAAQIEAIREKKFKQWKPVYGAEIAEALIGPGGLEDNVIDVEGHPLEILFVDQADCAPATTVWIRSLSTLVAADLAFNGTHLYVAEHDAAARAGFLANVEKMADLGATTIIPGHKVEGLIDDAATVIAWTSEYLRTFERLLTDEPDEDVLLARVAETWGHIPLEFAVPLNAAAALRGEFF